MKLNPYTLCIFGFMAISLSLTQSVGAECNCYFNWFCSACSKIGARTTGEEGPFATLSDCASAAAAMKRNMDSMGGGLDFTPTCSCSSNCGSASSPTPSPEVGGYQGGQVAVPTYQQPPTQNYYSQQMRTEEADKKAQEAKRRQEDFDKNKQEILKSMKGITENELGLKGIDMSEGIGLKGVVGETPGSLGLKTLFEKPSRSTPVDLRGKGPSRLDVVDGINISSIKIQDGVENPAEFRRAILGDLHNAIKDRLSKPNEQTQEILRSFKMKEPPSPDLVKNIDNLAPGDVILVAPVQMRAHLKDEDFHHLTREVIVSQGINLLDRWLSNNWSSPVSHAAIFLGERDGKRWYMDNTMKGPEIKDEENFLKEYGEREMDVATLVGQPLSKHEGEEMWKGAKELTNTVTYGPSNMKRVPYLIRYITGSNDAVMVCSEAARWELLRAGRRVPETQSGNVKIFGVDIGLNKKNFVAFSPSDFYEDQQYFLIHELGLQKKEKKKP